MTWTVEALKEHTEMLFSLRDHEAELTRQLAREQVEGMRREMERRLDSMNAHREQIEHERGNYLRKDEYERRHAVLERRWEGLDRWRSNLAGRAIGLSVVGGVVIAAISATITHAIL